MKFSESWLRELVSPVLSTDELIAQVTMAGLEVDGSEPVAENLTGVLVGEIISIETHPNADKLKVCQVWDGDKQVQVVCGAPNARTGIKVPFATVGAVLPDDFVIKKAKLRGVESQGMLCAQNELGLGEDASGLWELPTDAPVGVDFNAYLGLNDSIIEVDLTPNRGDCLSIRGLAREVGVLNQLDVKAQVCTPVEPSINDTIDVNLHAPEGCARYVGRVIKNLDLSIETPLWMQERLRRSGIRSLGPAVDVTNYVLIELGQPMHAFDLDKIDGAINVRMGQSESLVLLDDSEVIVNTETLVIASDTEALALAGIMGGAASAVNDATCDIMLESAWFNPLAIAGKARHYGKHTDSSHRFERGVDAELQVAAMELATALLCSICGGSAGPVVIEESVTHLPQTQRITLRDARLCQQLGMDVPAHQVDEILTRLGLEQVSRNAEAGVWNIPSWRFDLAIEQDLIEEVARIVGYNNLPVSTPLMSLAIESNAESLASTKTFRSQLVSQGYQEVITYSFVDPTVQSMCDPEVSPVSLTNPISSDMAVMRTNLWPGLLTTAMHNLNRQQTRVRIFELGQCFVTDDSGALSQASALAGLICGSRVPEGWTGGKQTVDFYDLKGDVESVLAQTSLATEFSFAPATHPALHPGQSAMISRKDCHVGWIGQLHPEIQKALGLSKPVYLFQIAFDQLTTVRLPSYQGVSKFPEVKRDLAFMVASSISADALITAARQAAGEYLTDLKLFDVYQIKDVENKGKSIALGLTFQHDSRTLTDDEVNRAVASVVAQVKSSCDADLRV